jgi:ribosome-associated protein
MRTRVRRKAVEAGAAPKPAMSGLDFARQAARIAEEMHAEEVLILDLRGISSVADFFVIGTGTSDRQMRAIADEIEQFGRGVGQKPYGHNGYDSSTWLLTDYVDVVVHLFDPAKRHYYDLELLWGDAPRIDWHEPAKA